MKFPYHGQGNGVPGRGAGGHEQAADAGDAARHHGEEETPSATPLVHDHPAHEIRGDFHGGADEEAQMRIDAQISRVESQPIVDQRVGQPVEGDDEEVPAGHGVVPEQNPHAGIVLGSGGFLFKGGHLVRFLLFLLLQNKEST